MKKRIAMMLALAITATTFVAPVSVNAEEGTAAYTNEELGIVDGKFTETKKITVEVYDRGNDGGTDPTSNVFAQYIKDGMLAEHNVEVEFVAVPRWTETEVLNNLLASGDAPDVCVTYSYPTIETYAAMGGVINTTPLVEEYYELIPDLVATVTDDFLHFNEDPETKENWSIIARVYNETGQKTYVREDWLAKLGMEEPTTLEEFEAYLYALKDNAEMLLGEEADQMVPFLLTSDVRWHARDLAYSTVPGNMTDKELYIYAYDDSMLLYPNHKEAIRILNKWYNDGLLWDDFALYAANDAAVSNMQKAGYVGSYMQNVDDAYRNGDDGIQQSMQRLYAEDAAFITVNTFKNEDGVYKRYMGQPTDRHVFFPATNDEPVASLMYLNYISKMETRKYLQIGEEGINHEVMEDGSYKILGATGDYIQNSLYNIDLTITNNGLNLDTPEITVASIAQGYAGVDPKYIIRAFDKSDWDIKLIKNAKLGSIEAETTLGISLNEKRDAFLSKAVTASVEEFDAVYDAGMSEYLSAGGQAIIDERTEKWEAAYGDATMLE